MGKLRSRVIAAILLVVWCTMVCAGNRNPQYRGLVINTPDTGEIVFFVIYVILGEIAKKLDKGYICPVYCEVNHKHRIVEYDTKRKQSINEETDKELDGPVIIADREQSKGSVRSLSDPD